MQVCLGTLADHVTSIFERLRALGWGEEVEKSRFKLIENSNVSKAQPLTDYGMWFYISEINS